ncbi:MAG: NTP transferase domain-containing protein [Rhodospirillaceae bacterium]
MRAIILAAGQGTRMRAIGPSKPMVSVEGTALLERVIINAMHGGVSHFTIVTGYNSAPLQRYIQNLAPQLDCKIECVENSEWHLGNGRSVLAAKPLIDEPFHILMADHLVDPQILPIVRHAPLPNNGARLGLDLRLQNPHVDIDDVTKVFVKDGLITDIGKTITGFNAFDTGVFWSTPGLFDALEKSIAENHDDSLSGGIRVLAAAGLMTGCDIGNRTWIDVDTPALLSLAQEAMVEKHNTAR